jgi:predicted DNA-binding transcriptional regulator AlpA
LFVWSLQLVFEKLNDTKHTSFNMDDTSDKLPRRLLSKQEVCARVHRSYPTIWVAMVKGLFPRAREQGDRPYWFEHEIDAYLEALPLRPIKGEVGAGQPEQLSIISPDEVRGRHQPPAKRRRGSAA